MLPPAGTVQSLAAVETRTSDRAREKAAEPAAGPASAPAPAAAPPVLMGLIRAKEILEISPQWQSNLDAYEPNAAMVDRLRTLASDLKTDLRIEVVLGSWCGDSREQVPKFLRIQRAIGRNRLPATFLGVDRTKKEPAEAVAGKDIQRVPTFIVRIKGAEIGRIVETPQTTVEADLVEILSRAPRLP